MIIYKITNKINNKVYIGQTIRTLNHRINRHFYNASIKVNLPLYDSINKYGKDNFLIEIIKVCENREELDSMEIYYIELYKSINREFGYNLTTGGKSTKLSKESCEKIKKYQKSRIRDINDPFLNSKRFSGKKLNEYHRLALLKSNLGRKLTEEQKLKFSRKGHKGSETQRLAVIQSNKNRVYTELTKSKLSKGRLGKKHTLETKLKISQTKKLKKLQQAQMGNVKQ